MARLVWSGSISFGLVTVAVKAYPAVRDHDVHFHQLDKESGSRVRNRKIAEKTGEELEASDIEMGFEISKGKYVTFDKEELAEMRPESNRAVEVTDFVALDEVDPIYYERTYWLGPDGDAATKAYQLLLAAMADRERVAVSPDRRRRAGSSPPPPGCARSEADRPAPTLGVVGHQYGAGYQERRCELLAGGEPCYWCGSPDVAVADRLPLSQHPHRSGVGCCTLVPSCKPCSQRQAGELGGRRW